MAQMALYRAWRPLDFDSVVAQQQIVQTLKQAVKNGEVGHAYLFCGTRGTGKTSLAKILARAVNCLNPREGNPCNVCEICQGILDNTLLDVQEIDAASNNSVDNVRRIIDEIVFLPVLAKYKVYVIDEVHMLSPGAFNALLKTLEEPPAHAIFILATTEPHRIPATILSRCQRFDFRRIPDAEIVERLRKISLDEHITIDDEGLEQIAVLGDGALRDAISLLDQSRLSFPTGVTAELVRGMVGSVNKLFYADLAESILAARIDDILLKVATVMSEGRDIARFAAELASFFRDILVAKVAPETPSLVSGSIEEKARINTLSTQFSQGYLNFAIMELSALMQELRWAEQARTSLEICLLKIVAKVRAHGPAVVEQLATQAVKPAPKAVLAAKVEPAPVAEPAVEPAPAVKSAIDPEPETPVESEPEIEIEIETVDEPEPESETEVEVETAPEPSTIGNADAPSEQDTDPKQGSFFDLFTPEDLALLSPETIASTEAEFLQNTQQAQQLAISLRKPDGSYDEEALKQFWKETLETLSVEEAFLFLFAREAVAKPGESGLELHFAERTRHHYNVLSSAQGHEVFATWDKVCAPDKVPLKLLADFAMSETQEPLQEDDDWMKRIRKVAEELNVPVEDALEL